MFTQIRHSAVSPLSRSPVAEEDDEVNGANGAGLIQVSRKKRRTGLKRPLRAEQLRLIGSILVVIPVQITRLPAPEREGTRLSGAGVVVEVGEAILTIATQAPTSPQDGQIAGADGAALNS